MSERQLTVALAASGRDVALARLVIWRKEGLLPPLASSGVGSGRSYYWREPDILAQAEIVHDCLARHGRTDATIITLWLGGFRTPLTQLRRAWQHRARMRKEIAARKAPVKVTTPTPDDLTNLLLGSLLSVGAALDVDAAAPASVLPILETALAKLGHAKRERGELARHLWQLVSLAVAALETSSLIRDASDEHLAQAQHYLSAGLRFLQACGADSHFLAEQLAPSLFLYLLAMLHSGQEAALQTAAKQIASTGRRTKVQPAHIHATLV
ncbi:MAG TPA: hypothetical protein VGM26_00140 [Rhizomicrobium sp.]|jgi:hypothetical protein